MAFGFFKKAEKADVLFINGNIYTQNGDIPWAEAVACKDGKIIAVGDTETIMELEGRSTEIIDLEKGYMLPGFIQIKETPEAKVFKGQFIDVSGCESFDAAVYFIKSYMGKHRNKDSYFACGLNPSLIDDIPVEESRAKLDSLCKNKPVVVLCDDGLRAVINTFAYETGSYLAAENKMKYISLSFLVNALSLLNLETIQKNSLKLAEEYCKRGITSIRSLGSLDYFAAAYQDILFEMKQSELLKQRFFGTYRLNFSAEEESLVKALRQKKTLCVDAEGLINFSGLYVNVPAEIFKDNMEDLLDALVSTADSGFDITINVEDKETAFAALDIFNTIQAKGYKKNILTLAHDLSFTDDEKADNGLDDLIYELSMKNADLIDDATDVENAIDTLTIDAAIAIGKDNLLGTIEKGKLADFVIFETNPLDCKDLESFKKLEVAMTVVEGKIVYDKSEDNATKWFDQLSGDYVFDEDDDFDL